MANRAIATAAPRPSAATGARTTSAARNLVGVVIFSGLTVLGANVYVPLIPVPITLQTLFVLLAGAAIGSRNGSLSQIIYLGLGAAGLPVFAGHLGGWGVLSGPTGGYLVSFLIVPWLVGRLLRRSGTVGWHLFVFTAGTAVIFLLGVTHLAVFYTHDWYSALRLGLLPFLPGAVFKVIAATSITRAYRALRSGNGRPARPD
jgi:biotin transport system substrate-specific component